MAAAATVALRKKLDHESTAIDDALRSVQQASPRISHNHSQHSGRLSPTPKERFWKVSQGVLATVRMTRAMQGPREVQASSGLSTGSVRILSPHMKDANGAFPSEMSYGKMSAGGPDSGSAAGSRFSGQLDNQARSSDEEVDRAVSGLKSNVARIDSDEISDDRPARGFSRGISPEKTFDVQFANFFSRRSVSYNSGGGQITGSATYHGTFFQERLHRMLCSPYTDFLMGLIIVVNLGIVTWEQARALEKQDVSLQENLEHVFLSIYLLECAARVYVWGLACVWNPVVGLDFLIVFIGVLAAWVIKPVSGADELGPVLILRIARLVRLVRALRLLVVFRELWMLVRGLVNAIKVMVYTCILLGIMLFAFASIGVELLAKHNLVTSSTPDKEFKEIVDAHFRNLPTAMLTLLQFVNFDNIVYIYEPLVKRDWSLLIFFVAAIMVLGIVLMNLVTAIIVNSALEQAVQDKDLAKSIEDSKRKKLVREMRKIFIRLDEDGSGEISREEIQNISDADKEVLRKLMGMADPLEIFDALDVDGDEELGIDEFVDGVWQVVISETPIHVKRMEKQMIQIRQLLLDTQDMHIQMQQRIDEKIDEVIGLRPLRLSSNPSSNRGGNARRSSHGSASVYTGSMSETTRPEENYDRPPVGSGHSVDMSKLQTSWTYQDPVMMSSPIETDMPLWAQELVRELRATCNSYRDTFVTMQQQQHRTRRNSRVQQNQAARRRLTQAGVATAAEHHRHQSQQPQQQQGPPVESSVRGSNPAGDAMSPAVSLLTSNAVSVVANSRQHNLAEARSVPDRIGSGEGSNGVTDATSAGQFPLSPLPMSRTVSPPGEPFVATASGWGVLDNIAEVESKDAREAESVPECHSSTKSPQALRPLSSSPTALSLRPMSGSPPPLEPIPHAPSVTGTVHARSAPKPKSTFASYLWCAARGGSTTPRSGCASNYMPEIDRRGSETSSQASADRSGRVNKAATAVDAFSVLQPGEDSPQRRPRNVSAPACVTASTEQSSRRRRAEL
mmetsp:Transcript_18206/g.42585  ORF Transcript_18206/g.42585 Transcript_18206/m.42585 type:complete len:1017 (+) Transcript_18206:138-3188(+)